MLAIKGCPQYHLRILFVLEAGRSRGFALFAAGGFGGAVDRFA
jgi:hypothetical protein